MSNETPYPAFIAVHSCVLGVFVPSGGGRWVVEAPYLPEAANRLQVNQGWMVVVHDLGEASANLLQPFWMLPTLAILGLKARDIMGYTFAMFLALFPAVLAVVTVLAQTLSFPWPPAPENRSRPPARPIPRAGPAAVRLRRSRVTNLMRRTGRAPTGRGSAQLVRRAAEMAAAHRAGAVAVARDRRIGWVGRLADRGGES
ncbi:TIGR00366 family protein [Streptomyces sp. 184]